MLKKKLFLSVLSVILSCSLLAGCDGGTNETKKGGRNSGSNSLKSASQTNEKVIKFGIHVANPEKQETVTNSIIEAFNKKYEGKYKVEFSASDTETHSKNMKLAATDGTLPDIFWIDASEAPEYAENDLLLDLSEYLSSSKETDTALNGMEDAFNNGKIQYGLPYQCNVQGIFYNKEIFDAAKVSYPTDKTTYEEFIKMVKDLKNAGYIPISIGSKNSSFAMWEFNEFLSRYGWEEIYKDISAGKEKYNNQALISCFSKIEGLSDAGAFPDNMTTLEYFDAKQLFNNKEAAMFGTGQWDCAEFDKSIGKNIGFFWGPVFEDSKTSQEIAMKVPSAPIVVNAKVGEDAGTKEAVYAFLNFYYGKEAAGISYAGSIFPATSYEGVEATESQYAMNAMIKTLSSGWRSPAAAPDQTLSSAVQEQLYDSIFGILQKTYSPQTALEKMDTAAGY